MPTLARVTIHPSQFPDRVRLDLSESLRSRRLNHKFLYESRQQTRKWLALHAACSPAVNDPEVAEVYNRGFQAAASAITAPRVHVVGLGCGGGWKDARLLALLRAGGRELHYSPVDVGTAMVLVARGEALKIVPASHCYPLVCDLSSAPDLAEALAQSASACPSDASRLITFFGMLPNFEPDEVLPRLAELVRPQDALLFSANLSPGDDYEAGLQIILPQYDNAPTRDWLLGFLFDLGLDPGDGQIDFDVEEQPPGAGLKRITARFRFERARELDVDGERFSFSPGEAICVFFSYRYTPALVRAALGKHGLNVVEEWASRSGEEGVFLVRRVAPQG